MITEEKIILKNKLENKIKSYIIAGHKVDDTMQYVKRLLSKMFPLASLCFVNCICTWAIAMQCFYYEDLAVFYEFSEME